MEAQELLTQLMSIPPQTGDKTKLDSESIKKLLEKRAVSDKKREKSISQFIDKYDFETERKSIDGIIKTTTIIPKYININNKNKIIIYIHGGAYTIGTSDNSLGISVPSAQFSQMKVISVNYRLAPEDPFPAALNDCLAIYQELINQYSPKNIGILGDSAGGSLALATLLKAQDMGLPMPGAVVLLSPWADITKTGETYYTLNGLDPVISDYKILEDSAKAYTNGLDMKNPLISPIYGEYKLGFPPTLIQSGTRDLFLSLCVRLYRKLQNAGIDVKLSLWEGMWHVFQAFPNIPEGKEAFQELGKFFIEKLSASPN
ncbi:MAG: alpha/beta hydrolase [Gloeotrichia echinulata GP01]